MEDALSQTLNMLPQSSVDRLRAALSQRRVCVTGGAGFIGSHLSETLVALGALVTVIDDLSNADAGRVARLMEIAPERVRFVQGSILDPGALGSAVEGARTVFHLAALGSVPKSVDDPGRTWVVNATGTMRVLQAAGREGVGRVVYSASSSAYGNNPELPKREAMASEPESPYAAAKLAGESLCRAWATCYGVDTVSLRYFNIFGAGQAADSAYAAVIPAFVQRYLGGRAPVIFGDGEQTRDFTHVSNAVLANLLAAGAQQPLGGAVVNIGAGVRTSVNTLAKMIAQGLGVVGLSPDYRPERVGEVRDSFADVSAAQALLDYSPVTDLETGLSATLAWYREDHERGGDAEGAA